MPHPWQTTALDLCRNIIRFAIWIALTLNLLMLAIFTIGLMFRLLVRLWFYLDRTVFDGPW